MEVQALGGVGEYGRSCFLLSLNQENYLFDCGKLKDANASQRYPSFSREMVSNLHALFLSHSHDDHSGALPLLIQSGFTGNIYLTKPCYQQLKEIYFDKNPLWENVVNARFIFLEDISTNKQFSLPNGHSVEWGYSGHLLGSVWYFLHPKYSAHDAFFYSGDMNPFSPLIQYDNPPPHTVNQAIIDAAYGLDQTDYQVALDSLLNTINRCLSEAMTILLPLPRFGRGQEILILLHQFLQQNQNNQPLFLVEKSIWEGLQAHLSAQHYLTVDALSAIDIIINPPEQGYAPKTVLFDKDSSLTEVFQEDRTQIIFCTDGMLQAEMGRRWVKHLEERRILNHLPYQIILTGYQAPETYGAELLRTQDNVSLIRYRIHLNFFQAKKLADKLNAKNLLLFHANKEDTRKMQQALITLCSSSDKFLITKEIK